MKPFLAIFCLLTCSTFASAQDGLLIPELNLFDPIPGYAEQLPDEVYRDWARIHNQVARERAFELDAGAKGVNPTTTVTTTEHREHIVRADGRRYTFLTRPFKTNYTGSTRTTTRDYRRPSWRGGPVLLINPYYRN